MTGVKSEKTLPKKESGNNEMLVAKAGDNKPLIAKDQYQRKEESPQENTTGTLDTSSDEKTPSIPPDPSSLDHQTCSDPLDAKEIAASYTILTKNGCILNKYNAAGIEIKCERYIGKKRSGQTIFMTIVIEAGEDQLDLTLDENWYALAHFFDTLTRQTLTSFRHPISGDALPLETLRIMIGYVDDMIIYRVCMTASPLLRSICTGNFRVDDATVFVASNETKTANVDKSMEMAVIKTLPYSDFERPEPGNLEKHYSGKPKEASSLRGGARREHDLLHRCWG